MEVKEKEKSASAQQDFDAWRCDRTAIAVATVTSSKDACQKADFTEFYGTQGTRRAQIPRWAPVCNNLSGRAAELLVSAFASQSNGKFA